MKQLIAFVIAAGALAAAPVTIPHRAVKSADGSYHYRDAHGKKWIYRQTPFGVSRVLDRPVAPAPIPTNVTASDAGDAIRFERPGPFGTYRWERKKTDQLNDMERAAWRAATQE